MSPSNALAPQVNSVRLCSTPRPRQRRFRRLSSFGRRSGPQGQFSTNDTTLQESAGVVRKALATAHTPSCGARDDRIAGGVVTLPHRPASVSHAGCWRPGRLSVCEHDHWIRDSDHALAMLASHCSRHGGQASLAWTDERRSRRFPSFAFAMRVACASSRLIVRSSG